MNLSDSTLRELEKIAREEGTDGEIAAALLDAATEDD